MKKSFYLLSLLVGLLLIVSPLRGQYEWNNLGPDNLGSITRTMAELPDGRILAGSQGGGLWVSDNRGVSWSRFVSYDEAGGDPNVTSIAVNASNGYIYVGTGAVGFRTSYYVRELNQSERNYDFRTAPEGFKGYLDGLPGTGVWIWNGSSWSNINATTNSFFGTLNYKGPFVGIQKVEITASGRIFIATIAGLYYSDNRDLAFGSVFQSEGSPVFKGSTVYDVEYADGDVILAGTHSVRENDSLYISTNRGVSFTSAKASIFYAGGTFSFGRTAIAVSPQDRKVIYAGGTAASGELNGVYRSSDNGVTWSAYAPKGSPGFTPLGSTGRDAFTMEVFPDNKDELIVAGQNWYTFLSARGWTQTAQHTAPFVNSYIPRRMYSVLFLDGGRTLFIGTGQQITRSDDRGATFSLKSKGYEAQVTYTVASNGLNTQDALITGTPGNGVLYNQNYTSPVPVLRQGFGRVLSNNYSKVAVSFVYPAHLLAQSNDGGIERSLNSGENFERFYGSTISPQVAGLTNPNVDTLIDREDDQSGGGVLYDNRVPAMTVWALDERVPQNLIDGAVADKERIQEESSSLLFFCSGKYLWVANGIFGDALQVKWNRVTNQLVDGVSEFITSIAVSPDPFHTVWIGSSKGGLWRVIGAHDLNNFNATTGVLKVNTQGSSGLASMTGRWISDIAVDPSDPNRVAITYAGYGGDVAATNSFVFMTSQGMAAPVFYPVFRNAAPAPKQPMYAVEFVDTPDGSVLMLGTETSLYSISGLTLTANTFFNGSWRNELGNQSGPVPVYDIYTRKYKATITNEETLDFRIEEDNTIFVATHGRGIWSTASLADGRKSEEEKPFEELTSNSLYAFPNPVTDGVFSLAMSLPAAADVTVSLMSLDGRVVTTHQESVTNQEFFLEIPTDRIAQGYYIYRVDITSETGTETFRGKVFVME
ncbi:MAG: T9SS type A sorting domain-containing protein [Bacteroidia bacterium]|nr:T9SS type A sorting domain-containing protein [Bacteroidia bacterium]